MLAPLTDADPRNVGQYRLQGRLGTGGMGAVYLGFGTDGHPAAVKVVRPELAADPEFRERFRREVSAARRVHGTFVAEVRDADVDAPLPWMATDYVEGVNLGAAVADRGHLSESMLVNLATGLADALVAVHAAGLVHRDLKPSNILLAWDGPKVIDFGIARDLDGSDHTRTGHLIGTVAWMAPEQLLGERAGPAADIFSWAMCVVFAATGRHPFPAGTPTASAFRSLNESPDLAGVTEALVPLLLRALDKNPAHRPSAVDLVSTIVGQQVTGVTDADEATRRLLGAGWVAPTPPPSPVPIPTAAPRASWPSTPPLPTSISPTGNGPFNRRPGGRRGRLVLAGTCAVILLVTGAGLALALSRDTGNTRDDAISVRATVPTASGSRAGATASTDAPPTRSTTPPAGPSAPGTPSGAGTTPTAAGRPTETGRPLGAGVPVTVYADTSGATVPTWRGPTTNPVFGRLGAVADGATVTLYCAVYGQSVTARNTTSRLWDYTSSGWINDTYTHTGTLNAVVPACVGNIGDPRLGTGEPRTDTGPFAVAAGNDGLAVRSSAGADASVIATLRHGDLVRTVCWVHSTYVPPPPGLSTGSDNWNRLSTDGWIPDTNVYSATTASAAPAC
ncbi:serine/threonine-protein kinase [Candidatus Protofrankia californiensis]|uniref:serine/threonine-protein kinase n=1 Tax=Candidatus Protofrankia californiensis TaxID=1839754 RepID=UPI0019D0AA38|nr:serine/threonine-protein kinase [Candidatus Protofrankia californiensis]